MWGEGVWDPPRGSCEAWRPPQGLCVRGSPQGAMCEVGEPLERLFCPKGLLQLRKAVGTLQLGSVTPKLGGWQRSGQAPTDPWGVWGCPQFISSAQGIPGHNLLPTPVKILGCSKETSGRPTGQSFSSLYLNPFSF